MLKQHNHAYKRMIIIIVVNATAAESGYIQYCIS